LVSAVDVTFAPDSTANTITLRPALFAEINDNVRVTLTFHFWSGTKVTYFVTKSRSTVTGSTS
jgi:endoglucanase